MEKSFTNEVEAILLSIDEIADVMVYGEVNIITGQTVVCDVVLETDIETKYIKKGMKALQRKLSKLQNTYKG